LVRAAAVHFGDDQQYSSSSTGTKMAAGARLGLQTLWTCTKSGREVSLRQSLFVNVHALVDSGERHWAFIALSTRRQLVNQAQSRCW